MSNERVLCHFERPEGVEKSADKSVRLTVRATAARGAGAWEYAPLPRGGPDRIVSFRSALDSVAFWNRRSVGIRRDALPRQGSIVPQKQNAFSVSMPQNGTSRAKTAIVTEKHDHLCGRNTWRSEQMSCRVFPTDTAVQVFDHFSVQWCRKTHSMPSLWHRRTDF